jgi:predicted Zn-dependent protease
MGEAYLNAGNPKKAKQCFEESLAILRREKITEEDYPAAYEYLNQKRALVKN